MPFRLISLIIFFFFFFLFPFPFFLLLSFPFFFFSPPFTRQREGTIVVRGTIRCSLSPLFPVSISLLFSFFRFTRHECRERGRGANGSWFQIKLHGIIASDSPYHWRPVLAVTSMPVAGIAAKPVEEVRNVEKVVGAFQ